MPVAFSKHHSARRLLPGARRKMKKTLRLKPKVAFACVRLHAGAPGAAY